MLCVCVCVLSSDDWISIVGSEPSPLVTMSGGSTSSTDNELWNKYISDEIINRNKTWKKGTEVLFWCRTLMKWRIGSTNQIKRGYIHIKPTFVEMEQWLNAKAS